MSTTEKNTSTNEASTIIMHDKDATENTMALGSADNDLEQAEEFQDEERISKHSHSQDTLTSPSTSRRFLWMVGFCILIPVAAISLALAVMASRRGDHDDRDGDNSSPLEDPPQVVISASGYHAFTSTEQLYDAVDAYLLDNSSETEVARTYGWPIGTWDVSRLTNFDRVFDATPFGYQTHDRYMRSNTLSASFNEDLSGWDTSRAVSMSSMFDGAEAFNQDLSTWDVSNVVSFQ
jgi:surface protein